MKLDDRLRSAATSLRRDVDAQVRHDIPAMSLRPTTFRRRIMLAIGVAVVVAAGSLAAVLQRDGSDSPSVRLTDAPRGPVDHFRIDAVPDGMVLQLAADGSSTISEGTADWKLEQHYIRYNTAHDRADGILTIRSGPGNPNSDLATIAGGLAGGLGYSIEPIEIRGHAGIRIGPAIAWQESPGVVVAINGPLSKEELLNVANGLRQRQEADGFDPQYLPAGYEVLAERPGYSKQTADSIVWYSARSGTPRTLKLFVTKDTSVPLLALLADPAKPDARLVDVRGHRAVVTNEPSGQKISWDEHARLRLQLTGTGLTSKQLLTVASSIVPLTNGQWARYGQPHSMLFPKRGVQLPTAGSPTNAPAHAPVASTSPPTSSDALGLTVQLPSGWTLQKRNCPSAHTVTVVTKVTAKPLPTGCERVSGPWVYIQRIPKNLTGIDNACGPGYIDNMPICQAIEVDPSRDPNSLGIERRFYAGLDALVSIRLEKTFGGDVPAFTYSDPSAIQAVAAGTYQTPQSLIVAKTTIEHALAGGCSSIADEAAPSAVRDCGTLAFPTGGVFREASTASIGGSVPAMYFIVSVAGDTETLHYRVLVQNHWDAKKRWVTQSVTSIVPVPGTQSNQASMCTTPPSNPRFSQRTPFDCPTRK